MTPPRGEQPHATPAARSPHHPATTGPVSRWPPPLPPGERRRTLSTVENDAPGGRDLDRRSTTIGLRVSVTERRWERRIVVDATVNHRIEAVFPYLSDPTQWHDFAPAVEFRRQIDAGPPRVGTRWMATDRIGPFRIHFIDRLDISRREPTRGLAVIGALERARRVRVRGVRRGDAHPGGLRG